MDISKHDMQFYIHYADEDYTSGDPYFDLSAAIDAARDDALSTARNVEITQVLTRTIKRIEVSVVEYDV